MQIEDLIQSKRNQIQSINREIIKLKIESFLLSDDKQWYTETEEEFLVSKRPKKTEKALFGCINWVEVFVDADTGQHISIKRSRIVKKDGQWVI